MGALTPIIGLELWEENEVVQLSEFLAQWNALEAFAGKLAQATTADLTLYVDAALGDDANNGLSALSALKTLQTAINKIPQIINHTVMVNVAVGTYAESVLITGFTGKGNFAVIGAADTANAANYKVNKISVTRCTCNISINGVKGNIQNTDADFIAVACVYVAINRCITDTTSPYGMSFSSGSYLVSDCIVSNHTSGGLTGANAIVSILDTYGSGNLYGLYLQNGVVFNYYDPSTHVTKRIRGTLDNESQLYGGLVLPNRTGANFNVYVRPDGSDDNDGSADDAAHALLTIQEAIRRLPPRIDHQIQIIVGNGTYSENVEIAGFIGKGQIVLVGSTGGVLSDNHAIIKVAVKHCTCLVDVTGIKTTKTNGAGFEVWNCVRTNFNYCKDIAVGSYPGVLVYGSVSAVTSCEISNRSYAIQASYGSNVFSYNNTGTGNTVALRAENGATIAKGGTQPGGSTAEQVANGGVIR